MSTYNNITNELGKIVYTSQDDQTIVSYNGQSYSTALGADTFQTKVSELTLDAIITGIYTTLDTFANNMLNTVVLANGTLAGAPAAINVAFNWTYFPKNYLTLKMNNELANPVRIQAQGFENVLYQEFITVLNGSFINAQMPNIAAGVIAFPGQSAGLSQAGLIKTQTSTIPVVANSDQKSVSDKYMKELGNAIDASFIGNLIAPTPVTNPGGFAGVTTPVSIVL